MQDGDPNFDLVAFAQSMQARIPTLRHIISLRGAPREGVVRLEDLMETADVTAFSDWMDEKILGGDVEALANYRALAPFAAEEHPTEEHLLPLHVAAGAAGAGAKVTRLHSSVEFGFMRMDAYQFS